MFKTARNLQIDLLLGNDNPILDFFNKIIYGLSVTEIDVLHNVGGEFLYYKPNKWLFLIDMTNGVFRCNPTWFWGNFRAKFNLYSEEVELIIEILVNNYLDEKCPTPLKSKGLSKKIQIAFDNHVGI